MGMADLKLNSEIHHLKARIAELEAALHIATNDKLSLLDQLDQAQQGRMAQIDYGCDLQRIIEDLCRGGPIREPKTSARHHYNMAAEALSRTGAVKVKALDDLVQVAFDAYIPIAGECPVEPAMGAAISAVLSALEPTPPEGRQEPVAYRVHAPEDDYYGTGPDRLQFHPLAQYDMDNGYRQTPLYERPAHELSGNTGELIDRMASAIRGDTTSDDTPWATLSEDRKIGWRGDAERALAAVKEYLTAHRPSEQALTDTVRAEREVLLFASYCGGDNAACSDARPCPVCLGMSNVVSIPSGTLLTQLREFEPRWFANKHLEALTARKIGKATKRHALNAAMEAGG